MPDQPTVVLHYDSDGDLHLLLTKGITVLTVDERCPTDRVFRSHANALHAEIDALVGDGEVGHTGDERQALIRAIVRLHTKEGVN